MVKISLELDDDTAAKVVEAFCGQYGYQEKTRNEKGEEIDNPETKESFAKNAILTYCKRVVNSHFTDKAAVIAREVAKAAVDDTLGKSIVTINVEKMV